MSKLKVTIFFIVFFQICYFVQSQDIKEYYITCDQTDFQYIYANYSEDIYIPITISYNGETLTKARMRIRGDGTRVFPKKSLKVKIDSLCFSDSITVFNFNAEYQDKSYIQQNLVSRIMKESGYYCFDTEHVRLYLNGEYLGLYLYVENMDEDFFYENNLNPNGDMYKATLDGASLSKYDNVYYHWEKKAGTGGRADLQNLINMLDTVKDENYYQFAKEVFDYERMVNILAVNILVRNYSTYYHNYYMYRDVSGINKWIMLPWDLDKAFLYYSPTIEYYHSSTFWAPDNPFIERAVLCDTILSDIIVRVNELHSTLINDSIISPWVDSLSTVIYNSVLEDETDNIADISEWENLINNAKTAFDDRYDILQDQFFNKAKSFKVTRVRNRYLPNEDIIFSWSPTFDPNGDTIKYRLFYGFNQNLNDGTATIHTELTDTFFILSDNLSEGKYYYKVEAYNTSYKLEGFNNFNIFHIDSDTSDIVINEINYNSYYAFESGDWLELYNNSLYDVNMSGWYFSDNNDQNIFVFPEGTIITANSYIVLYNDLLNFQTCYPSVSNILGPFLFGLENDGELLRLYNNNELLVDSLVYSDVFPWPKEADGFGPALELIDPNFDNSLAESWRTTLLHGSPGEENPVRDIFPYIPEINTIVCFPNPFDDKLSIFYESDEQSNIELCIKDIMGKTIYKENYYHTYSEAINVELGVSEISTGLYFLYLKSNGDVKKVIKIVKAN